MPLSLTRCVWTFCNVCATGHDATIGINWDVIDYYIDEYAPGPTAYERYGPQTSPPELEAQREVERDR